MEGECTRLYTFVLVVFVLTISLHSCPMCIYVCVYIIHISIA